MLNGVQQKPIEGISFALTFDDGKAEGRRKTQYFELGCNRGLYHDGWMASAPSFVPWDPNRQEWDPDKACGSSTRSTKISRRRTIWRARIREKLRELQDLWWVEASKYNVLPLDWRGTIRMNAEAMGRPSLIGRSHDDDLLSRHHRPSRRGLAAACATSPGRSPPTSKCSTARLKGMIVTHGGLEGGYGLYLRDGKPTFVYNFLGVDRPTFAAKDPLPKGKTKLVVDFKYDGGGMGKGGKITMSANGKTIAEGRLERSHSRSVLARRGAGCRHGYRLAHRLHLQAALRVHGQDRKGENRLRDAASRGW